MADIKTIHGRLIEIWKDMIPPTIAALIPIYLWLLALQWVVEQGYIGANSLLLTVLVHGGLLVIAWVVMTRTFEWWQRYRGSPLRDT